MLEQHSIIGDTVMIESAWIINKSLDYHFFLISKNYNIVFLWLVI